MRYRYILLYRVYGVAVKPDQEVELAATQGADFRAILTQAPEPHCVEADRAAALSTMLLRGLTGGGPEGTVEERLAAEQEEVIRQRKQRHGDGTYLVILFEGETPDLVGGSEREFEDFVLRVNGAPKQEIRESREPEVAALVSSLAMEAEREVSVVKVRDAVVFLRTDGKQVFSFTPSGSATLSVSSHLREGASDLIDHWLEALIAEQSLARVAKLLLASLDTGADKLRSFLAAWSGLEIFVNKLFGQYEQLLFEELRARFAVDAHESYVQRIRDVMKDKYRLADKFAVIAVRLSLADADEDLKKFKVAKDQRDALAHGRDVDEGRLPIPDVQELLKKYLKLHLGRVVAERGNGG